MKKSALLIVFGFIFLSGSQGQFNLIPEIGINFSTISFDDLNEGQDAGYTMRKTLGVNGEFVCESVQGLTIFPGLFYSVRGKTYSEDFSDGFYNYSYEETFRIRYLAIPLLVGYNITDELRVSGGPDIGILLSAKGDVESTESYSGGESYVQKSEYSGTEGLNKIDAGANIRVDYRINEKFNVGVGYYRGFTDIYEDESSKSSVISIKVGYVLSAKEFLGLFSDN